METSLTASSPGGSLVVKHRGKVIDFAWAEADRSSIHWYVFSEQSLPFQDLRRSRRACYGNFLPRRDVLHFNLPKHGKADTDFTNRAAFYGDCEHEVLEVTSGYRITLTYNLYYSSIGPLARLMADPRQLPLFSLVGHTLRELSFMPKGKYSRN